MPTSKTIIKKDLQYFKFCGYGFFKNLRLFEPFLILFFLESGLSFLQIGIIYSIREITRNLLEIPAGIVADAMGRRRTMISAFTFYLVSFVVFYLSYSYSMLIVAMLFYALGDAFRTGTHKAMIFDYLKIKGWADQKTYYYGHTRSYSQLGSAVSSLIGGLMVFITGNFREIFIYASIPYILDLVLIASYPKSLDGLSSKFRSDRLLHNFKIVFHGFFQSFRKLSTLQSIGNLSLHTGYFRALKDYLQPVLQTFALSIPLLYMYEEKQRTAIVIGGTYFLIYLLTSLMSRNSGRFSSAFSNLSSPLNISLFTGLLIGAISGLFYAFELTLLAIVFFIFIYLIENLRKPIGIANIANKSNKEVLATVLSAESQMHSLVAAMLAPLIGFLADEKGLGTAIIIASVLLILIVPVFYLRRKIKIQ